MFCAVTMNAAHSPFATSRRRRRLASARLGGIGVLLLAFVLAVFGQSPFVRAWSSSPVMVQASTGGTGTGGSFVPVLTRLADTRNGTGGYTGTLPAGTWQAYQVTGVDGVPASGVASVVLSVTALAPTAAGNITLAPNTSRPTTTLVFEQFDPGDNVSNTGIVDVGTDGKIAIRAGVSVNVIIDIQGYFTSGNGSPEPGGYVSAHNTRLVDTRNGTGVATGQLGVSSTTTFSATGGSTGIPTTATALYANITVLTSNTTSNYVTPYPTGTSRPVASLTFDGATTAGISNATAIGTSIDLNSSGQFSLWVGPNGGSVDVVIDIQGYFDGEPSTSGFTPVSKRVYDSRVSPGVTLAGNSVTSIQVGGVGGIPAGSSSLAGVALNVESLAAAGGGALRIWPGDQTEPGTSNLGYTTADHSSSLTVVQPSLVDGTIKIRNIGDSSVDVVLDAEGYFTNPLVLPPAVGINVTGSGSRAAAAMISHSLTDRSGVLINPTNGNLLYTQSLLSLAGVGQSASVGVRYNALNDARPTLTTGLFEDQLYRNGSTGAVTYTAPDGAGYVFTPNTDTSSSYTGTNAAGTSATLFPYTGPAGINASLVRVGSATSGPGVEYDLTFHPGQSVNVYVDNGANISLNSSQDVTGANKITYTYGGANGSNTIRDVLTRITDTQGRTIDFAYASTDNPTQPSTITDNSLGRTITLTYAGGNGELSEIVDATGAQTLFGYNPTSRKLSSVTDGLGNVTSFTYGTGNKLSTMTAAAGSTSTTPSTWTMGYPSATSTTVADPMSHSNTYAYSTNATSGEKQVSGITDARGHAQSRTYNSHNDVTSGKTALNDTTNYDIATSTYNLTKITSPTVNPGANDGRTQTATYTTSAHGPGGTFSTVDYRPISVTDTNANNTQYEYNGFGEAKKIISAGTGTGAAGTRYLKYQGDDQSTPSCGGKTGQLCTSTDGKGNVTSYSYNSAGNLTTMTPPSPLGASTFTYDAAGRKISETDGRSHTSYTCYDEDDRITQVSYTSSNCATASGVTYGYDAAGNLTSRITAATGDTVTWTYDSENRPLTQTDPNGNTSATYDKASNVLTVTDSAGSTANTTTYTYDDTNNVATLAEPGGSCPAGAITPNSTKCTLFSYDDNNRRLTTQLPNGVTNSVTYDGSGRQKTIHAAKGSTVTADRTYKYDNSGLDSGVMRTKLDTIANTTTTYTYDAVNRLAGDTVKTAGTATVVGSDSYLYDLNGNMTKQVTGGTTSYYGYNAADQMCWIATTSGTSCTTPSGGTAFTYDANGNTLTGDASTGTNTWSNYDQLATVTVGGARSYSYAGTSNAQRVEAGSVTFTSGVFGQLSSDTGGAAARSYIRDPGGTLIALQTGGSSYYYTLDDIGSVIQLTSSTGAVAATYTYNPYGKTTATTGGSIATTNPYRYASGYTDGTSLIKFGARYYNPTLARFTQTDPSGQEANNYAYAGDNPVTNTDLNGLYSVGVELQVCFICISYTRGRTDMTGGGSDDNDPENSSGHMYNSIGVGVGTPGASAELYAATGNESNGPGWSANASAWGAGAGYGSDGGELEVGASSGYGAAGLNYTWQ